MMTNLQSNTGLHGTERFQVTELGQNRVAILKHQTWEWKSPFKLKSLVKFLFWGGGLCKNIYIYMSDVFDFFEYMQVW